MAVEDILVAIRADAEEAIERIRAECDTEVAAINARAQEEADAVEQETAAGRDAAAARERARIINRAQLAADRAARRAGEEIYQQLVGRVIAAISAIRGSPRYRQLLVDLLEEARPLLPGARRIRVDPTDVAAMEEVVANAGLDGEFVVAGDISTAGGLALVTDDGRAINNTVESRIDRADLMLRQIVAELVPPVAGGGR